MSIISLVEIDVVTATQFWTTSPDATAFTNPEFLNVLAYDLVWIGAYKGDELCMIVPLIFSETKLIIELPHTYYVGPIWSNKWHTLPIYRQYKTRLNILEELIAVCINDYGGFTFSFAPGINDLRAFQWWNYHVPDLEKKVKIEVNYTAILKIRDKGYPSELKQFLRPDDKRKIINKYEKQAFSFRLDELSDINCFISLYIDTLSRSNGDITEDSVFTLERMAKAILKSNGSLLCLKNDNEVIAAQLLLPHRVTMNAIAQGTKDNYREIGASTILNYECIKFSQNGDLNYYDFNGANSPNRADDKHAFGAEPQIYYSVLYADG